MASAATARRKKANDRAEACVAYLMKTALDPKEIEAISNALIALDKDKY